MAQDFAEAPAPPKPTAEHIALKSHAGTWKVQCTFYMDPAQPPMEVEATETVEMFGEFWTTSLFESNMFGAPYKGRATLGFEPHTGKYVSTWIDTMNPAFFHFTGGFDESGKVLEMTGEGSDCMGGGIAQYVTRETHTSDDERTFEMFMKTPDGGEWKMFTHVYTRA